jgi:GNAT superfamily N-acetyltransferase
VDFGDQGTNPGNVNLNFKDVTYESIKKEISLKRDVCRIYQEFIDRTHSTQPADIEKSCEAFFENKNGFLTLLYLEGDIVGFVEYRAVPRKFRDKNEKVEITSLFVRPHYQKKGLGRALVEYVRQFAENTGRDRIVLYSDTELTQAHEFYEKLGFRKDAFLFELKV